MQGGRGSCRTAAGAKGSRHCTPVQRALHDGLTLLHLAVHVRACNPSPNPRPFTPTTLSRCWARWHTCTARSAFIVTSKQPTFCSHATAVSRCGWLGQRHGGG